MTNEEWKINLQKLIDVTNQSTERQIEFYRSILVAGASVLGILISLHTTQIISLYIRLVFALSILLLLLGILLSALVLYDLSFLLEKMKVVFRDELHKALKEEREPAPVTVPKKKRTLFCQEWSLIFLLSSSVFLVIYTFLALFVE